MVFKVCNALDRAILSYPKDDDYDAEQPRQSYQSGNEAHFTSFSWYLLSY